MCLENRRSSGCLVRRCLNGVQRSAAFLMVANLLKMERETGIEPATSSLGNSISIQNKKLMRRKRRILSTQVYEGIDRTFPRFRNRSNRSNNKLPQDCLESPHGMPAEMAGRQRRHGGIPPYANLRRFAAIMSPT